MSIPSPPKHLKAAGKRYWQAVNQQYLMDECDLVVLAEACTALDRATRCRQRIDIDGEAIEGRFGNVVVHPLLHEERESRALFSRLVKHLALDLTPAQTGRSKGGISCHDE